MSCSSEVVKRKSEFWLLFGVDQSCSTVKQLLTKTFMSQATYFIDYVLAITEIKYVKNISSDAMELCDVFLSRVNLIPLIFKFQELQLVFIRKVAQSSVSSETPATVTFLTHTVSLHSHFLFSL